MAITNEYGNAEPPRPREHDVAHRVQVLDWRGQVVAEFETVQELEQWRTSKKWRLRKEGQE